jgi:hypothetical protein
MLHRHLIEGQERISRQQRLIDRLRERGLYNLLKEAEALLAEMLKHQETTRRHLWEVEETDRYRWPDRF